MDFMLDQLVRGRRIRILNVLDEFSRVCHADHVDTSIPGAKVVRILEAAAAEHGLPESILSDNGSGITDSKD